MRKRRIFGYSFVRQIVRWLRAVTHASAFATNYTFSNNFLHIAPRNVPLVLSGYLVFHCVGQIRVIALSVVEQIRGLQVIG